jgi:hypothetical protein
MGNYASDNVKSPTIAGLFIWWGFYKFIILF